MTLVDPQSAQQPLYPALCLVQLRIPEGTTRIDCIGYFRKQQMRAWWPINVGELAHLQRLAIERLGGHTPGEIVTISSVAIGGSDRPRVVVPRVDRWAQGDARSIWELALSTLSPGQRAPAEVELTWRRLFSDWLPGEVMERDGAPLAMRGIDALADAVEICARSFPNSVATRLVRELRDLSSLNHEYWRNDSGNPDDATRYVAYDSWRPVATSAIGRIVELVATILDSEPEV